MEPASIKQQKINEAYQNPSNNISRKAINRLAVSRLCRECLKELVNHSTACVPTKARKKRPGAVHGEAFVLNIAPKRTAYAFSQSYAPQSYSTPSHPNPSAVGPKTSEPPQNKMSLDFILN